MQKSTEELLEMIKNTRKIEEYFSQNSTEMNFNTLQEMIEFFMKNKGISKNEVVNRSQIERHYGYQIISGVRTPSRDKLIMICFGLTLNLDETQNMLKKCGFGELYPRDTRDAVIIFSIHHGLSIMDTNELLYDMKLKSLE